MNNNRPARPSYWFVMLALTGAAVTAGCSDDDGGNEGTTSSTGMGTGGSGMTGDGGSGGGAMVPADPQAVWLTPEALEYAEVMPGVVSFASAYGDFTSGAHGTFAKVTAGMGLPSHSHSMGVHAINVAGPIEIPVPSDQTTPPTLTVGGYGFVPPGAEHAMNCLDSATDCVFFIEQAGAFDMNMETPAGGTPPIDANPMAVQTPLEDVEFVEIMPGVVEFGSLHGDFMTGEHGTIVRVTAGMGLPRHWHTDAVDALVIKGEMAVPIPYNQTDVTALTPGSYFYVPAGAEHMMNCNSDENCMFYIHQAGAFDMNVVEE